MLRWLQHNRLQTWLLSRRAERVGEDEQGNVYYRDRGAEDWRAERRWVVYAGDGAPEPTRVPAGWAGWLHKRLENPPDPDALPLRRFALGPQPNPTGTEAAYAPEGHPRRGGERPPATGDYQAWSPDMPPPD